MSLSRYSSQSDSQLSQNKYGFGMTNKLSAMRSHSRISTFDDGIPLESLIKPDDSEDIQQMLSTVDSLTDDINIIEQYIHQISNNHIAIISSFQNEAARKENEELHAKLKELSHHITDELKRMKQTIDRADNGPARNTADHRIRKAQYSTLARKFRDIMMEYSKVEEEYREKNKEKIERQLKVAGKNVSDEQLEEMLEKDNPQTFTQSILGDSALLQRRHMLTEVETRHMEIQRLEENIKDLHNMFYDLAQLVYDQGDLINQIEYNVDRAEGYIERGVREVTQAANLRRGNRKLNCIICCIVTTITIIIILVIVITGAGIGAYFSLRR